MVVRVAVVGAGIIGCSTALRLLQSYGDRCDVTLISDKFSPDTTSDKASAIVLPFDITPSKLGNAVDGVGDIEIWLKDTVEHIRSLYDSPDGGKMGIALVHMYEASEVESTATPWWSKYSYGFKRVEPEEQAQLFIPPKYKTVLSFTSFNLDCRLYLPQLLERFRQLGGKTLRRKIDHLSDLKEYDIVINCTGLGSASLVPDPTVYPVRGDAVSVHAPWIKHTTVMISKDGSMTTVTVRAADVMLGNTAVATDNAEPSSDAIDKILKNCSTFMPSLSQATILQSWVGLRPMRSKIRLERDTSFTDNVVIHCYGHGSKGIAYHWGCAVEIDALVKEFIT
jgi:glycine/D-amino acid oxidase-like deaminating enzyme